MQGFCEFNKIELTQKEEMSFKKVIGNCARTLFFFTPAYEEIILLLVFFFFFGRFTEKYDLSSSDHINTYRPRECRLRQSNPLRAVPKRLRSDGFLYQKRSSLSS